MKTLLLIIDASMASLGLTIGLVMGVVVIQYAFVMNLSPALVRQFPAMIWITVIFILVGLLFLYGFFTLLRGRQWRWPIQGVAFATLGPAGLALKQLMS